VLRALVAGGSGYLGSAIVRALVRRGHQPIAFSRHPLTSPAHLPAIRPSTAVVPSTTWDMRPGRSNPAFAP
jgi:uncharacterized protein YbjT (DUF2867 family)